MGRGSISSFTKCILALNDARTNYDADKDPSGRKESSIQEVHSFDLGASDRGEM
jgi:hypothetical protein